MNELKRILVSGIIGLLLGVLIGNITKPIPQCEKCSYIAPKYIKQFNKALEIKRKEIKKETNETINYIDTVRVYALDSIWTEYANRYKR